MTAAVFRPGPGPVFFFSYARPPRVPGDWGEPDGSIVDFFNALSRAVAATARIPDAKAAARSSDWLGARAEIRSFTEEAIASCDVFVPLYSPRYLSSESCGKEWTAFTDRLRRAGIDDGRSHTAPVLPILWAPPARSLTDHSTLPASPPPATGDRDLDEDYLSGGVERIRSDPPDEISYAKLVNALAVQIIEAATRRVPPTAPIDLDSKRPVPPASFRNQPLGVCLLAPTLTRPTAITEPSQFGHSPLAWNPFAEQISKPLAQTVTELANNLGWMAQVFAFDDEVQFWTDRAPRYPWILIVEPRALDDEHWRAAARQFDTQAAPWAGTVAVWRPGELSSGERARLEQQLNETLKRTFAQRRPTLRIDAPVATTPQSLASALRATAHDVGRNFVYPKHNS